jgi:hypothetical protein
MQKLIKILTKIPKEYGCSFNVFQNVMEVTKGFSQKELSQDISLPLTLPTDGIKN